MAGPVQGCNASASAGPQAHTADDLVRALRVVDANTGDAHTGAKSYALTNRIDESESNICIPHQEESVKWISMHSIRTSSPKRYAEVMSQIAVA